MAKPRLTIDLRNSRALGGRTAVARERAIDYSERQGNPTLRNMSPMRARSLCKAELQHDPKAKQRYAEWSSDFEEGLRLLNRLSFEEERQR